jgi:hypothetical protein
MGNRIIALSFGRGNAKLAESILTFSLPAGWTCPLARNCKAVVDRRTGKLVDGRQCKFRCFSASQEALYPNVRKSRWRNYELLRACNSAEAMKSLILRSLLPDANYVRIHVAGDFFSQRYFDAWILVAISRPQTIFYAYTKSIRYWLARRGLIPFNLRLTASLGGKDDAMAFKTKLPTARVVFAEEEAANLGLPIDHANRSYALLLHGMQPKGTLAGEAIQNLRRQGKHGYRRRRSGKIPPSKQRISVPTVTAEMRPVIQV